VLPEQGEPVVPIESEPCKLENNFTDMESERTAAASTVSSSKPSTSQPAEEIPTVDYTAASSSNRHKKREGDDPLLGRLVEIIIGPDIGKIGKVTVNIDSHFLFFKNINHVIFILNTVSSVSRNRRFTYN